MQTEMKISDIVLGQNPRVVFEAEPMKALTASVKALGIIEPLVVMAGADKKHILIAGFRRLKAAQNAGLESVPVIVRGNERVEAVRLAENELRQDLKPFETANYVYAALKEKRTTGKHLAEALGRSEAWVSKMVKIGTCYMEKADKTMKKNIEEAKDQEALYQYVSGKTAGAKGRARKAQGEKATTRTATAATPTEKQLLSLDAMKNQLKMLLHGSLIDAPDAIELDALPSGAHKLTLKFRHGYALQDFMGLK